MRTFLITSLLGMILILILWVAGTSSVSATSPTSSKYISNNGLPTPTTSATLTDIMGQATALTLTITPTPSITPEFKPPVHLPLVFRALEPTPTPTPINPPSKVLYCDDPSVEIPDDTSQGVSSTISIEDLRYIVDLDIRLDVSHPWVGDLAFTLTHQESGNSISLIHRPGLPGGNSGCGEDDIAAILDDDISLPAESQCSPRWAAISGIYFPEQPLAMFDGEIMTGNWELNASDHNQFDVGQLNEWCLAAVVSEAPLQPTPTPTVLPLPDETHISGVTGQRQSLPLDCESRSAVDWANYFDVQIDEIDFFHDLPESDHPDVGFVGSVYGAWGQIPPAPYGVHAEPVANLLRDYGLSAHAHRPLSWDSLRAEIATGRPVIVWILGNIDQGNYEYVTNGIPVYYFPPDETLTIVARYEHTIIVTGYTPSSVTFLNGGTISEKSLSQFLESWSALGNMAITTQP